jgi:hypothetical protein
MEKLVSNLSLWFREPSAILGFPKSPAKQSRPPPIAIAPPHVARRVAVQRSQFVLFGLNSSGLSDLEPVEDGRLTRIEIIGDATSRLLAELKLCGIFETTLFPDLEALARELQGKYAGPKKRLATWGKADMVLPNYSS